MKNQIEIVSLFAGAGGLDLGFEQAGYVKVWANEYDSTIWSTYKLNFPDTYLDTRSILDIDIAKEIPNSDGIIGGPPCQSWSEAGTGKGIEDARGKLTLTYLETIRKKQPKFFLMENVKGMLMAKHKKHFDYLINSLEESGYNVSWKLVNANDYNVPQDRFRVIIVGLRKDLGKVFKFPKDYEYKPKLKDAIKDLPEALPALSNNKANLDIELFNHEYYVGGYSTMFMARNRVRGWDEPSFTIQAGARHCPLHPKAPKMQFVSQDVRVFKQGFEHEYRRLSVRECARIQTFPDSFKFVYKNLADGYKMVGNAVPINLAIVLAKKIMEYL